MRAALADGPEARAAVSLLRKLSAAKGRAAMAAAMDTHWREIYEVADLIAVSCAESMQAKPMYPCPLFA